MKELKRIDKNGTKYYEGDVPCTRCTGYGLYIVGVENGRLKPTHVDSGVCWKCGGTGKQWGKWKEYTPEYEAKLEEKRRKRREKYEAEHAEEIAARKAEQERKEAERKAEEERKAREEAERKAKSQHVGNVGERIELEVTYEGTATFERPSFRGFGTETVAIHRLRDDKGDLLVWKTTSALGVEIDGKWYSFEEGDRLKIKGTVKEHTEYRDEKQTVLLRVKASTI